MNIREVTERLDNGLYTKPNDIFDIFISLEKWFSVPNLRMNTGNLIYRARLVDDISQITNPRELSYTSQKYNKTFKRASSPNHTMFYGISGDSHTERICGCLAEICDCFRNNNPQHNHYNVAVGVWETTCELVLPQIINIDGINKSDAFRNASEYTSLLSSFDNAGYDIINFWRFMNKEFTKLVNKEEEYWISAMFTEWLVNRLGYNGVIYESVQSTDPKLKNNHCVALRPDIADKHLQFKKAFHFEFDFCGDTVELIPKDLVI